TIIPSPPLHIPSMVTLAPQDRGSHDKHIKLVNIIGNPGAGMLTRAMAKQLSAALAHECLFIDFLSKEEPKKTKVDDWEFNGLFGVLLVDNVEEQSDSRLMGKERMSAMLSSDAAFSMEMFPFGHCPEGNDDVSSENSGGKRLAISMVEEAWLSEKKERIPNIDFLHVFGCPIFIHNHKDHLEKFYEKADDGYFLGYSLVSKAFRVFNIRRQQTEETCHITFDESLDAIKFTKPLVDNINSVESERYPPDEYLYPYEPSQRYQTNSNDVSFIEPYESPELIVLETKVSTDQNGQADQNDLNYQNDHYAQTDEILDDDQSKHPNHTNDEQIIDNLQNTKYMQIFELLSSLNVEDTSVIQELECSAMAKELSVALAHECLFIDSLSKEEPKKVSEALKHHGWVNTMQDKLN
nr:retrovirus-related Pol polyprotein from transposon TNT 1-94 [Tanacetum cinerariifolium]